jgi:hypothetical protein
MHEGEMSVPFEMLTMKVPRNEQHMDWMIEAGVFHASPK